MEALAQVKAALDSGLISSTDYASAKTWFLKAQQVAGAVESGVLEGEDFASVRAAFLVSLVEQGGGGGGGGGSRGGGVDSLLLPELKARTNGGGVPAPPPPTAPTITTAPVSHAPAQTPHSVPVPPAASPPPPAVSPPPMDFLRKGPDDKDWSEEDEGEAGEEAPAELAYDRANLMANVVGTVATFGQSPASKPPAPMVAPPPIPAPVPMPAPMAMPAPPTPAVPSVSSTVPAPATAPKLAPDRGFTVSSGRAMSGVGIADECLEAFANLKKRRGGCFAVFKVEEGHGAVVLDAVAHRSDGFDDFVEALPPGCVSHESPPSPPFPPLPPETKRPQI